MTEIGNQIYTYDWQTDIAPYLNNIVLADSGFSKVKGTVQIANGVKVFVKIANNELIKQWIEKEVEAYSRLSSAGYQYIPKLLSVNSDYTGMAIEYLDGYSFENKWDKSKLEAILKAQESLKKFKKYFSDEKYLGSRSGLNMKWIKILEPGNLESLNRKLNDLGQNISYTEKQIKEYQEAHKDWSLKTDTLVHEDLRADNFGYNETTKDGKIIDWNWLRVSDESLDTTAFFVNIYDSGFDPYELYPKKYNYKTLIYLMSFWLEAILKWDENEDLDTYKRKKYQARSIGVCMQILNKYGDK